MAPAKSPNEGACPHREFGRLLLCALFLIRAFVDLAFSLHRDSTLAAKRMAAHPSEPARRQFRAVLDLVFGSPGQKQAAFGRLDSVRTEGAYNPFHFSLEHPVDGALRLKVNRALSDEEDDPELGPIMIERGQLSDGVAQLQTAASPTLLSCELAWGLTLGLSFPDSLLKRYLDPSELEDDDSSYRSVCTGISLVEQGRGNELDSVLDRLRSTAASSEDSTRIERLISSLKGYRAWKSGSLKRAERLWAGYNDMFFFGAIWRGDLYRELGRLNKAEGWYLAAWSHPVAHERLGRLYEEMGRPQEAAEAYERFIEAWKDADPVLQDRVTKARKRLDALGGEEAAE